MSLNVAEFEQMLKTEIRNQVSVKLSEQLKTMVEEQIQKVVVKEFYKEITKVIKHAVKDFATDGFIISKDNNYKEELKFVDYFKKTVSADRKYKFTDKENIETDSYGLPLIDLIFGKFMKDHISKLTENWVKENQEIVRNNINAIVTNNIKKELFGTKLPDQELLALSSPIKEEAVKSKPVEKANSIDPDDLPF